MKRWPLIRHIRWLWLSRKFWLWWQATGKSLGAVPNERDLRYLDDVREGRA
jgi:hypothetical protein